MTTINPSVAAQPALSSPASAASSMGSEFNSFIQLLTAQVKNQDPLSPLDSTQFVEQLATFSTLEQQVHSNRSLESIAQAVNDLQTLAAGFWTSRAPQPNAVWYAHGGGEVSLTHTPPGSADAAALTVRDATGTVVSRSAMDVSEAGFVWRDPAEVQGTPYARQMLQFSVEYYAGGASIGTAAPMIR